MSELQEKIKKVRANYKELGLRLGAIQSQLQQLKSAIFEYKAKNSRD